MKKLLLVACCAVLLTLGYFGIQNASARAEAGAIEIRAQRTKAAAEKKAADEAEVEKIVAAKKIRIGMTIDQVRRAWGEPKNKIITTTASGTDEQWVYESQYVYFEDGKMTSLQTSK